MWLSLDRKSSLIIIIIYYCLYLFPPSMVRFYVPFTAVITR
jgi:hypothetical protein